MSKMRCAIYARYSSDLQHDRSIEDQIRNCRRFADDRGWVVLHHHIYSDRAKSGASTIGRKGFQELLRTAKNNRAPFDYVLADDTSRLSRKAGEVESIIGQLKYYGIHAAFVSQGIDSRDQQSQLTIGVNSIIDSQFRRDLAKKTLRGLTGQVLKGYSTGQHVYGYKYIKEFDPSGAIDRKTGSIRVLGTRMKVHTTQAEVVQKIFDMWSSGVSIRTIVDYLNTEGIDPPGKDRQLRRSRKRALWVPNTVRNMLQNPKYIGDWTFNKGGWIVNPETGQRRYVKKDVSEWTINPQPRLAIIQQDLWSRAQQHLEKSKTGKHKRGRRPSSRYLFSGLMKCFECRGNFVLVGGSDRSNPRFGCCTNYQRGTSACNNSFKVSKDEIERVILSQLQERLFSPAAISAIINLANKLLREKLRALKQSSTELLCKRRELSTKLQNLIAAIENGTFSPTLKKRLVETESEIAIIDGEIQTANEAIDFDSLKFDEEYVLKWLRNLHELARINPPLARTELMPVIQEFTLSPEVISDVKYLRVRGKANIDGLLAVACGGNTNIKNTGRWI